jgi:hypothetical protein
VLSAFGIHVATLVGEIDPALDAEVIAALIINSVSARVIRHLQRDLGNTDAALERGVLALVSGLTRGGCPPTPSG